jgi:uncharacterized protein (TIGR03435 family)
MARVIMVTCFLVAADSVAIAQPAPAFDLASVKLTAHGRTADGWSVSSLKIVSPGRLVAINASLGECLRWAYEVKEFQISGPGWLDSDAASYDIEAKAPPETPPDRIRLMFQTLLAERFGLALHRETKTLAGYALEAAKKGPKLRPASTDGKVGFSSSGGSDGVHVTSQSGTMIGLAHRLSLDLDRPVFDRTEIQGRFSIDLQWAREGSGPSIFSALQEQLGLKLEPMKAPFEILVIDHAEKVPTAN